jgi:hypothetical protein
MPTVRVATFNVENLFARFKFEAGVDPENAVRDGWDVNKTVFRIQDEDGKRLTGLTIKEANADVLALQEVENLDTLKRFRSKYLGGAREYPYAVSIDGNDPRLIDVAVLSRLPVLHVRTYQHLRSGRSLIFSRDCLEVDVDVGGRTLTLFVNHLKSMLDQDDPENGRRNTRARRMLQTRTVKRIVANRFGSQPGDAPFVVLGDLNDYPQSDAQGTTGIRGLLTWDEVENVVGACPPPTTGRTTSPAWDRCSRAIASSTTCSSRRRSRRRRTRCRPSCARAYRPAPPATPGRASTASARCGRRPRTTAPSSSTSSSSSRGLHSGHADQG